ncbi:hypothetical protein [Pedococcus soli]
MTMQVCHFHADEGVRGTRVDDDGMMTFTCPLADGHPKSGPYTWLHVPTPPEIPAIGGLAAELGLAVELPAALRAFRGKWVEYGVLEHAYATANPEDFTFLVDRYGHTAIRAKPYTTSAFLARTLSDLSRIGSVLFHWGPSTGRWSYNSGTSWWALAPEPDWSQRLSWAETGRSMDYVPGNQE